MLLRLNLCHSHRPGLSVSGQYFQLMVLVAVVVKIEPRTRNIGNKNNKKSNANIVKSLLCYPVRITPGYVLFLVLNGWI